VVNLDRNADNSLTTTISLHTDEENWGSKKRTTKRRRKPIPPIVTIPKPSRKLSRATYVALFLLIVLVVAILIPKNVS